MPPAKRHSRLASGCRPGERAYLSNEAPTGADCGRLDYERPPQQPVNADVRHSSERPTLSSVFGTSKPLPGPSGALGRSAFTPSESTYMHWVPVAIADRINVVKGIIGDIRRGHVPNIFA